MAVQSGSASFAGGGTLTSRARQSNRGSASFTGVGWVAARADPRPILAGKGALLATLRSTYRVQATLAGGASIAADARIPGQALTFDAQATLAATGTIDGTPTFTRYASLLGNTIIRSVADLLYLFRDNQAAKSIGSGQFRDLIASLHPASGNFQDLPNSAAGLASGRIYLNGDILQVSSGTVPALKTAQFSASGAATFSATARVRRNARATITGVGGLSATATPAALFYDDFTSLSLYDQFGNVPGTWYPSQYWAPDNGGVAINNTWILNPFNPTTPFAGFTTEFDSEFSEAIYQVTNGSLALFMQPTPASILAACANKPYLGAQLVAPNVATFGRFEARLSIPALNGTECAFYLISNSGGVDPIGTEINLEMTTGATWSPRSQWQFAIPAPGWPDGVPSVAVRYMWDPGMPVIDLTQMNTFAFEMRPTFVACYVNGQEVMRVTPPTEFGHNPWCIYLGFGDANGWTGPLDANPAFAPMLVDYVKVTA